MQVSARWLVIESISRRYRKQRDMVTDLKGVRIARRKAGLEGKGCRISSKILQSQVSDTWLVIARIRNRYGISRSDIQIFRMYSRLLGKCPERLPHTIHDTSDSSTGDLQHVIEGICNRAAMSRRDTVTSNESEEIRLLCAEMPLNPAKKLKKHMNLGKMV